MGVPAPAGIAGSGLPPPGDQANAVVIGTFSAVGPGIPFAFRGGFNIAVWATQVVTLTTTAGSLTATITGAAPSVGTTINSPLVPPGTTVTSVTGSGPYTVTLGLPPITIRGEQSAVVPQISRITISGNVEAAAAVTGYAAQVIGATITGPGIPSGTTVTGVVTVPHAATAQAPAIEGTITLSAQPTVGFNVKQPKSFFTVFPTGNGLVAGTDTGAILTGQGITYSATMATEVSFDGGSTWVGFAFSNTTTAIVFNGGNAVTTSTSNPEKEVLYRLNCIAYSSGNINYRLSTTGGAASSISLSTFG
jgi:hypothetical protein